MATCWECPLCTYVDNFGPICGVCDSRKPACTEDGGGRDPQMEGKDDSDDFGDALDMAGEQEETAEQAERRKEDEEEIQRWCRAATASFDALCTVAVLFHVRAAPLFLRSVAPTVAQVSQWSRLRLHQCIGALKLTGIVQSSGRPFDEVTVRTLSSVSPQQLRWVQHA
jgi:hypothetical protein